MPWVTQTWSIRRCGECAGWVCPSSCCQKLQPGRSSRSSASSQASANRCRRVASSGASGGALKSPTTTPVSMSSVCRSARAATCAARRSGALGAQVRVGHPQRPAVELEHGAQRAARLPAAGQRVDVADQDRQPGQQRVAVLTTGLVAGARLVDRRAPRQLHVQRPRQQQGLVDVLAAVAEVAVDLLQADHVGVRRGQHLGQPRQVVPAVLADAVVGVERDQPDRDRRLVGAGGCLHAMGACHAGSLSGAGHRHVEHLRESGWRPAR